MKIGDYVRTKKGTIYQFNSTSSKALSGAKKYMVKSSPNIIDLIEVGDYVNGRKIETKYYCNVNQEWIVAEDCGDEYYDCKFANENIKTVVTKEQFEVMQYKVGE